MKKYILLFFLIATTHNLTIAQSLKDTKDFLKNIIGVSEPLPNYDNAMLFFEDVLKSDADRLSGKTLTQEEYENIIIFGRDVYMNGREGWLFSHAECADLRDLDKVSIIKSENKGKYAYVIVVYFKGNYYKKKYVRTMNSQPKYEYLEKMNILINNDYEVALKIKKAIIHIGKLYGITVRDGDLF